MLFFFLSIVDEDKRSAIQYLYDKYDKDLIKYAKSKLKNVNGIKYDDHINDVVNNTYMNLLLYLPEKIEYEKAYVFQVLKNEIAKFLKKESKIKVEQIDDTYEITSEEDFINDFLSREKIDTVKQIIKEMDFNYQIPVFLYYGCQVPVNIIAKQLEITESAVYARLGRARTMIKKKYEEEEGENG